MFEEVHELDRLLLEQQAIDFALKIRYDEIRALQDKVDALRVDAKAEELKKYRIRETIYKQKNLIQMEEQKEKDKLLLLEEDVFHQNLAAKIAELTQDFPAIKRARAYQLDDIIATVACYEQGKTGMLNANDMGAGKTAETVMTQYILSQLFEKEFNRKPKVLWLTKKSLMKSTPVEIRRWWPEAKVVTSSTAKNIKEREFCLEVYDMVGGFFLTNYEFVRTTAKALEEIVWDFVIIDEVHKLKGGANSNGPTAIWEACKELAIKARFNMMLTGTPMVNKPEEMWSYLHIFSPSRFPTLKAFRQNFGSYKSVAGILELTIDPIKILNQALKGQMIRRSRSEFGIELPELDHQIIELEMNPEQREVYNLMRDRFFVWLDKNSKETMTATAIIAQLTRLRQINVWPAGVKAEYAVLDSDGVPIIIEDEVMTTTKALSCRDSVKIDESMDRIEMVTSLPSQIDDSISEQIVIFSTFNEPLKEIRNRCDELKLTCEIISGEQTYREKNRDLEAEFQSGTIQVLCINSAMGEGLNLQKNPDVWIGGASYGIMLDKWWSPARNEQCIGRIHRPGATFPVTFWEFQNESSIDAFIQAKNDDKTESFKTIMDSDEVRPNSSWKDYLKDLL